MKSERRKEGGLGLNRKNPSCPSEIEGTGIFLVGRASRRSVVPSLGHSMEAQHENGSENDNRVRCGEVQPTFTSAKGGETSIWLVGSGAEHGTCDLTIVAETITRHSTKESRQTRKLKRKKNHRPFFASPIFLGCSGWEIVHLRPSTMQRLRMDRMIVSQVSRGKGVGVGEELISSSSSCCELWFSTWLGPLPCHGCHLRCDFLA